MAWKGRNECLKRSRKRVHDGTFTKAGKPIYKYFWQCAICKSWFDNISKMEVDHIIEIGPLKSWEEIKEYIERMYCPVENLQCLCSVCHQKKTAVFNSALRYTRKPRLI